MKLLLSIVSALVVVGASPALAGQSYGGQSGGCRIGCSPYGGGNVNVNVNSSASASAYASSYADAYARSGGYVEARGYDVRSIAPRPAWVTSYSSGGSYGYGSAGGYGHAAYGPVGVRGPGYGPSQPFGYVVEGFGRRYATTDRCDDRCYAPPPPCDCEDDRHYGHAQPAYDHNRYSGRSGSSYSVRESYSESTGYAGGYHAAPRFEAPRFAAPRFAAPRFEAPRYPAPRYEAPVYEAPVYEAPIYETPVYEPPVYEAPRYAPQPYYAAPLEPVVIQPDYAPPPVYYSHAEPEPRYAPEPQYQPAPARPPLGYYGDLPPGDTGQGMPYRQEPGERG